MNDLMWAYLMHLGTNMWGQEGEEGALAEYHDHLTTSDEVWRETIDFLPECGFNTVLIDVGDGIVYESHPEINIAGAWSKDKLKKELDRMRAMGLTPIPKLNFSASHDAWLKEYSFMISTGAYYRVVEDLIKEVAEAFGYPAYFHLGMDEEVDRYISKKRMTILRPGRIWWHDVNFMFGVCDAVGARPWVWADKCWYEPEEFTAQMSKQALISNFWYNSMSKNPDGSYKKYQTETYRILERAGFDQVPTCSTFEGYWKSAELTLQMGKTEIAPERLKGYMTAPWWPAHDECRYGLKSDAYVFRCAKELVYPQTDKT